jgi:hypothetical protein
MNDLYENIKLRYERDNHQIYEFLNELEDDLNESKFRQFFSNKQKNRGFLGGDSDYKKLNNKVDMRLKGIKEAISDHEYKEIKKAIAKRVQDIKYPIAETFAIQGDIIKTHENILSVEYYNKKANVKNDKTRIIKNKVYDVNSEQLIESADKNAQQTEHLENFSKLTEQLSSAYQVTRMADPVLNKNDKLRNVSSKSFKNAYLNERKSLNNDYEFVKNKMKKSDYLKLNEDTDNMIERSKRTDALILDNKKITHFVLPKKQPWYKRLFNSKVEVEELPKH